MTPRIERIVRSERPFNAGTPIAALAEPRTPVSLFYVRSHFDVPAVDPAAWRLEVGGLVERPLALSLADLQALPAKTLVVTMECAGNGRTRMTPVAPGTPWDLDAVSTAAFTGTPLAGILDAAGVAAGAVEIFFAGADRGTIDDGRTIAYERSLGLGAARDPDVLVAWAMDGEPLPPDHGPPARLLVPGWYGMASVKWLARIEAIGAPFRGFYQAEDYVWVGREGIPDGTPLDLQKVRAVIARPADGERVGPGPVEIAGTAWSGAGAIVRVEVSADGGRTWADAALGRPDGRYARTPWSHAWTPAGPGRAALLARATDAAGETQPLDPPWNALGYVNHAVHRIEVEVG